MLDVKNPEIDVEAIMQRIQDKVRLRREAPPAQAEPRAAVPAAQPDAGLVITQHLANAREFAQVGLAVPPMSQTHGLKRAFATIVAKIVLRLAQLFIRDQRQFNLAILEALQAFADRTQQQSSEMSQAADRLAREASAGKQELTAKIGAVSHDVGVVVRDVELVTRNVGVVVRDVELVTRNVGGMSRDLAALDQRLIEQRLPLERRVDELELRMGAAHARMAAAESALAAERHSHAVLLGQVRTAVSLQERRLTLLLEETRRRLPKPLDEKQLQTFANELTHVQDAKYLSFEDTFRGSREDIKQRVSIYVPRFRAAEAGTDKAPILDVGCGRGELLEVLRHEGLKAAGVDSNVAAVDKCRELGLDVALGDLFETLAKTADGSLGGLVALHVVEHLPFALLQKLLDEALRVLRPGGIVIFETPNPLNILVGASNFHIDPTHRNPVHPQTLHYLVETRGLIQVESLMLHPYPKEMRVPEDTAVARMFNEYFYGPQDYAVLGRRP